MDLTGNPGNGWFEPVQGQNPPKILRIDLAKESITPKQTDKQPNLGAPGSPIMGGIVAPAINNAPMGANVNAAYNDAGDNMPF